MYKTKIDGYQSWKAGDKIVCINNIDYMSEIHTLAGSTKYQPIIIEYLEMNKTYTVDKIYNDHVVIKINEKSYVCACYRFESVKEQRKNKLKKISNEKF